MMVAILAEEFAEEFFILQVSGTFDLAEKKGARKERGSSREKIDI